MILKCIFLHNTSKTKIMFTIITAPLVPLHAEADYHSELSSQLLFGEQIEILESSNEWHFVRCLSDNYTGWTPTVSLNRKNFTPSPIDTTDFVPIKTPAFVCFKTSSVEKISLPGGGITPLIINDQFELLSEIYQVAQYLPGFDNKKLNGQHVVELALQYINAPYLWGGKTIFGMDCAGLIQVVYSMLGITMPRDTMQQVEKGKTVDFISEVEAGDIAYFENNEGEITHVGILLNSHQIIHASGYVKIEIIDSHGIISSSSGEYTHKLRVIKRMF